MAIINFFKSVGSEFKYVVWPTRRHTFIFTIIVIVVSIAAGYFLGLFDVIFTKLLGLIL